MMVESLVLVGKYRQALDYASRLRDSELDHGAVHSAWARTLLPSFFLGHWDTVMEMASRVQEAWTALERPPSAYMSSAVATAAAVAGYRGDYDDMQRWLRFAADVAGSGASPRTEGIRTLVADVEIHHGRFEAAANRLEEPPKTRFWQASYMAIRAEALVRSRASEARAALSAAEKSAGECAFARAVLLRSQGCLNADESMLRQALAAFQAIECPHQAARTSILLDAADRARGERVLTGLGVTQGFIAPGTPAVGPEQVGSAVENSD